MSELEDEGVRAILRRLDELEPIVARLVESVDSIAKHGACWTYNMDGGSRGPVLAGQDFANATSAIREDLARLREQIGVGRWDSDEAARSAPKKGNPHD